MLSRADSRAIGLDSASGLGSAGFSADWAGGFLAVAVLGASDCCAAAGAIFAKTKMNRKATTDSRSVGFMIFPARFSAIGFVRKKRKRLYTRERDAGSGSQRVKPVG